MVVLILYGYSPLNSIPSYQRAHIQIKVAGLMFSNVLDCPLKFLLEMIFVEIWKFLNMYLREM